MNLSTVSLLTQIFFILTTTTLLSQVQIGSDINGEYAEDISGSALSLSANGKRIAIGGPRNDDGAENAAHENYINRDRGKNRNFLR